MVVSTTYPSKVNPSAVDNDNAIYILWSTKEQKAKSYIKAKKHTQVEKNTLFWR